MPHLARQAAQNPWPDHDAESEGDDRSGQDRPGQARPHETQPDNALGTQGGEPAAAQQPRAHPPHRKKKKHAGRMFFRRTRAVAKASLPAPAAKAAAKVGQVATAAAASAVLVSGAGAGRLADLQGAAGPGLHADQGHRPGQHLPAARRRVVRDSRGLPTVLATVAEQLRRCSWQPG